jgi:hypothetical protein
MSERCCYVYEDGTSLGRPCNEEAEWAFYTQGDEESRFVSCDEHLSKMLEDGVSIVYPYKLER